MTVCIVMGNDMGEEYISAVFDSYEKALTYMTEHEKEAEEEGSSTSYYMETWTVE